MTMLTRLKQLDGRKFILFSAVLGLFIGGITAYMSVQDEVACQEMQDDIREEQTFDGTVTCHTPTEIDVNISDDLDERADLECVCRMVQDDTTRILPIMTS